MRFLLTETPYLDNPRGNSFGNYVDSFLMLIATLLVFVFVLAITYMCTKWIANYQKIKLKSCNLQIVESIPAGNNKMICLVKTGSQYMVVGIGKDEIHLLMTLSEEQLTDFSFRQVNENSAITNETFSELLNKFKEKLPKK